MTVAVSYLLSVANQPLCKAANCLLLVTYERLISGTDLTGSVFFHDKIAVGLYLIMQNFTVDDEHSHRFGATKPEAGINTANNIVAFRFGKSSLSRKTLRSVIAGFDSCTKIIVACHQINGRIFQINFQYIALLLIFTGFVIVNNIRFRYAWCDGIIFFRNDFAILSVFHDNYRRTNGCKYRKRSCGNNHQNAQNHRKSSECL